MRIGEVIVRSGCWERMNSGILLCVKGEFISGVVKVILWG